MTESPAYQVEEKEGKFEIRLYPGYILAQVDVEADFDSALGKGFSILAGYIFGANKKKSDIDMTVPVSEETLGPSESIAMTKPVTQEIKPEKIAMTAPVAEEKTRGNVHRISFTMPSKYTLSTLPQPEDKRINFKEYKNQKMAVLQFSGRVKSQLAREKINEMIKWLSQKGIEPESNFIVAQYNHPAIPGFLRKNEIMVKI